MSSVSAGFTINDLHLQVTINATSVRKKTVSYLNTSVVSSEHV